MIKIQEGRRVACVVWGCCGRLGVEVPVSWVIMKLWPWGKLTTHLLQTSRKHPPPTLFCDQKNPEMIRGRRCILLQQQHALWALWWLPERRHSRYIKNERHWSSEEAATLSTAPSSLSHLAARRHRWGSDVGKPGYGPLRTGMELVACRIRYDIKKGMSWWGLLVMAFWEHTSRRQRWGGT